MNFAYDFFIFLAGWGTVFGVFPNLLLMLLARKRRKQLTKDIVAIFPKEKQQRMMFRIESNMSWMYVVTKVYTWSGWVVDVLIGKLKPADMLLWHKAMKRNLGWMNWLVYLSAIGFNMFSFGAIPAIILIAIKN